MQGVNFIAKQYLKKEQYKNKIYIFKMCQDIEQQFKNKIKIKWLYNEQGDTIIISKLWWEKK